MVRFKKGESFKGNRVHISSVFDQKGPGEKGKNVAFSISNDLRDPEDVKSDPMLVYGQYTDKDGERKPSYTAQYSASQWDEIVAASNKDGDAMVVIADLFPNSRGPGLVVNTKTLRTPDEPFNDEVHREKTLNAREAKKMARQEAQVQKEAEKEAEPALEQN